MSQLPLAFRLDKNAVFETFVAGNNAAALAHVVAIANGDRREVVWLYGSGGTGKTHLLQAACRSAGARGMRVMYVAFGHGHETHPDQLLGLESLDLLTLDGVDAVAQDPVWEARLFSVLNHCYAHGGGLLLAATQPPAAAGFALADLASRAAGAVVYRLIELDENGQTEALMRQAQLRGLELDAATARFLLHRVERGMAALCACLDRLDRASLAAQRRLTIPFIREALASDTRE